MKKILFAFMVIISLKSYSVEKSGIEEYDNLDLSRGRIVAYYDKDFNETRDSNAAEYYKKEYGKQRDLYILVYFSNHSDFPSTFYKNPDPKGEEFIGKYAVYKKNGDLIISAERLNGRSRGYNFYISNPKYGKSIDFYEYKDGKLDGEQKLFFDEKIATSQEYVNDMKNGKGIFYNKDGSISSIEIYKAGKCIEAKNVNYRLEKTGISKYDDLDFLKGEIIAYYDDEGNFVLKDSGEATQYRKSFGKNPETGLFLVADFYINTNNVQAILEMEKPYLFKGLSDGKNLVQFYENGNIKVNQVLNENKKVIEAKNYDYFGNLKSISTYENKKLVNIRYIEE